MADTDASGRTPRIQLEPMAHACMLNLRCNAADRRTVAAIGDALGVSLALQPNRWNGNDERAAVWLGPDEWLFLARDGDSANIERRVRAAAEYDPWLAVTEMSHAYTGFRLSGNATREVLAKGCPLDLDESRFRQHDCAQSLLAGMRVLLLCPALTAAVDIWVRNSFAHHAAAWLADAIAEFEA